MNKEDEVMPVAHRDDITTIQAVVLTRNTFKS